MVLPAAKGAVINQLSVENRAQSSRIAAPIIPEEEISNMSTEINLSNIIRSYKIIATFGTVTWTNEVIFLR